MPSHLVATSWLPLYNDIAWLPWCGGLTALGLVLSWRIWRSRGLAAGLRAVAWSLLPLAAYLTGVVQLIWRIVTALVGFAWSGVFSFQGWIGIAVAGLSVLLFVISGAMRRLGGRKAQGGAAAATAVDAGAPSKAIAKAPAAKRGAPATEDDLGDVADILKRHGIR